VNELIEEIETLKAIVAGLQQQLLRVGNQQDVLKAAYLAGQMAKPVKTFSGNKPNYVIPQEKFDAAAVSGHVDLTEWDINKLITEYGLTVVDGDIYAFAWAVRHASGFKDK
jgi:hypothetical protein